MSAIGEFLVRIGFDYDSSGEQKVKTGLKQIEKAAEETTDHVSQIKNAAKESAEGTSNSFNRLSDSFTIFKDSLRNIGKGAEDTADDIEKIEDASKEAADEAETAFAKLQGRFELIKESLAGIGVLWAGGQMLNLVNQAADRFDALGNTAKLLGTESAESLASLQHVFTNAGVELDTLNDGLLNMTDYIGQAAMGEGEGLEVFKALNIDIKDTQGNVKDTVTVFTELQEKLQDVDHAQRVAYINMLGLDTSLMLGLDMTAEEFDRMRQSQLDAYAAAGININESVKNAQEFKGALQQLTGTFELMTGAMGARFLATGKKTFDQIRKYLEENMRKIVTIMVTITNVAGGIAKAIMALVKLMMDGIIKVMDIWSNSSDTFKIIAGAIGGITAAVLILNSAFMKSPIGRLIALGAVIGMLIDDFNTWKEGGNSLIGQLIGGFDEVMARFEGWPAIFSMLIENFDIVLGAILAIPIAIKAISFLPVIKGFGAAALAAGKFGLALMASPIGWIIGGIAALVAAGYLLWDNWDTITGYLIGAWQWVQSQFDAGVQYISGLWNYITNIFQASVDFIQGIFTGLGNFFTGYIDFIMGIWGGLFDWFAEKFAWFGGLLDGIKNGAGQVLDFIGLGDDSAEGDRPAGQGDTGGSWWDRMWGDDEQAPAPAPARSLPSVVNDIANGVASQATTSAPTLMGAMPNMYTAMNNMSTNLNAGGATLPPMAAPPAANQSLTQNNNGDTIININAAQDPNTTAQAVATKQTEVQQLNARNFRRNIA